MKAIKQRLTVVLLALAGAVAITVPAYGAGEQYVPIKPAQPTSTGNDQIEVIELFWYGCKYCYRLETHVNRWLRDKPDDVKFVRIPGIFSPSWMPHARAYYTAEVLGVVEDIHTPLFETIHELKQPMMNRDALMQLFAEYAGVSNEEFIDTYESPAVEVKVRRAADLTDRYQAEGVPTLIVNGKYRTSASIAGGQDKIFKVVDELIAKERQGG